MNTSQTVLPLSPSAHSRGAAHKLHIAALCEWPQLEAEVVDSDRIHSGNVRVYSTHPDLQPHPQGIP